VEHLPVDGGDLPQPHLRATCVGALIGDHAVFAPGGARPCREALQLPRERHVDTYEEHGNLFGAALPISPERAVDSGALQPGNKVALGGFSHAGDYAAAAVIHWQPNR